MKNAFEELGLSEAVCEAIGDLGYTEPTPVQRQAIPEILQGCDIIAAAQTGTGKTAAFALPIMSSLGHSSRKKRQGPLCLIITPTRELAQQIDETCQVIGKHTGHRLCTVVGGVKYEPQIKQLNKGADILVATPGRLLDLCQQKAVKLNSVAVLVLDEADRMLDMGFWPSVRRIVAQVRRQRQTLLFSATISSDIRASVGSLLHEPVSIEIARKGETAEGIEQYLMPVERAQKLDLLCEMLKAHGSERVLVFTRTKQRADNCATYLANKGLNAKAVHADRAQKQRERTLAQFKAGKIGVLITTDMLSRGIDISEVSAVYNYDVPQNPEDYVHRIGRTGRAGEKGLAVTFMGPDEVGDLRQIEYFIKKLIPTYDLEGFPYRDDRIVPSPTRSAKRSRHSLYRTRRR